MSFVEDEIARFDPALPIERAWTPPSSWYLHPEFLERERTHVFRRTWQAVGRLDQVPKPGDYFTGRLSSDPYVVLRDEDETLRAFHNVCRHHAAEVCSGKGPPRSCRAPTTDGPTGWMDVSRARHAWVPPRCSIVSVSR